MEKHDKYPILEFKNSAAFEKWISKNYEVADGLWLKFAKANTGVITVTYAEAVDVALCYGWIDGMAKRLDDVYYLQKFTPRRERSIWSEINKKKVAALIRSKRMHESGLAAVREAKRNGRWSTAYGSSKTIKVPKDFQEALKKSPKALAFFKTLNSTNRFAMLFRLSQLKREETKQKRIAEYVKMLEEGKKLH